MIEGKDNDIAEKTLKIKEFLKKAKSMVLYLEKDFRLKIDTLNSKDIEEAIKNIEDLEKKLELESKDI